MATMTQGIENALKDSGDNPTGEQIKAGLEKITDFKTGVSDPITFTADNHAGLKSAPLFQVTGGVYKKIADPITIAK
jgi:branched-chain amino acid transport system substrate-binding protein